ncbi:MAG: hypothetical protein JZU64_01135 [Rhodoferax sp.]|jgi:hypothetical protein|nr:hypothetical protein [Rhodoferax sp.]
MISWKTLIFIISVELLFPLSAMGQILPWMPAAIDADELSDAAIQARREKVEQRKKALSIAAEKKPETAVAIEVPKSLPEEVVKPQSAIATQKLPAVPEKSAPQPATTVQKASGAAETPKSPPVEGAKPQAVIEVQNPKMVPEKSEPLPAVEVQKASDVVETPKTQPVGDSVKTDSVVGKTPDLGRAATGTGEHDTPPLPTPIQK